MMNWKHILISAELSLLEAMKILDRAGTKILFVCDDHGKLLGSLTDGDIRRGLIHDHSLEAPVLHIMNKTPFTLPQSSTATEATLFMNLKGITHVPLIDSKNIIHQIIALNEPVRAEKIPYTAVLMVGGLGTRLGELTQNCPKPMLPIAGKPVLEHILRNLIEHGFHDFILCVNYKAESITEYFGNGENLNVNIRYVHETRRMGTAGAMSLLPEIPNTPILVMNGDIVTKVNFTALLDFHKKHESVATIATRRYDHHVPFGVIKSNNGLVQEIQEKPYQTCTVSAGIYILDKDCINLIPKDVYFDMPQLFAKVMEADSNISVFPIHEYWIDIGREADLIRAESEYLHQMESSGKV